MWIAALSDCDGTIKLAGALPSRERNPLKTTTHWSPRLRFPVSVTASLPSVSSVGTKLGLERSTSKMTSGSVATRANAQGQTPRGGGLSSGARINRRNRFRYPKRSISCIQLPAHLVISSGVGGNLKGEQSGTQKRNKLVFLRNPVNSKGMAEARPGHQFKSTRCNTLISGRLSANAKKGLSLKA